MEHKFELKRRKAENRPPEELLEILCRMYPEDIAVQLFEKLTGIKLSEGEEDD